MEKNFNNAVEFYKFVADEFFKQYKSKIYDFILLCVQTHDYKNLKKLFDLISEKDSLEK